MFLEFIFLIILIVTFILLCLWALSGYLSKSRFTQTPFFSIKYLEKELNLKDNDTFYHIGCGDGRVLFYLAKQNPNINYIGIEDNLFFVFMAKIHNFGNRIRNRKQISILYKGLSEENFSEASYIFSYLPPQVIDELLPNLDEELKAGAKLISLNFKFTLKKPIKKVSFSRKGYHKSGDIFVYEF